MSRGARGGAGGRGGGHISSASRLNNGTLPFEVGAELEESWEKLGNSQDLFPVSAGQGRCPASAISCPRRGDAPSHTVAPDHGQDVNCSGPIAARGRAGIR